MTVEGSAAAKDVKTARRKTVSCDESAVDMGMGMGMDMGVDAVIGSTPAKRSESSSRDDSRSRSGRKSTATPSNPADKAGEQADDSAEFRLQRDGAIVESNRESNRRLRSRRARDSGSLGAGSSVPRPEKRGKRGEILTNRKRPPEGKRLNPRRKAAAAALGRGRSAGVVGDCESEDDDGDYVASDDGNSSSCSNGGASERRPIGRRKGQRRKHPRV